jgi:peptide/nickel transport system ATP-binding protein
MIGDHNGSASSSPLATRDSPLLSVRDLKTYFFQDEGLVKAVDGASFDVQPGRTVGIVGESGCGKSVTARSILRIVERPGRIVDGQILLRRESGNGRVGSIGEPPVVDLVRLKADGNEMRSIRGGEIALIFQEPMTSFSPVHTIGNQIVEAILLHRKMSKKEARDRAVELLQQVGIPRARERLDEYSYQLSGGLRQRAMIAMALAADPKLLIADEPTTALDVTTQAQILDLLRQLQQQTGMAIMLITHDLGVIAEMVDEVVVMYLGRVVEEGPVDDIFHAPKHPYTRALLRSIPSVQSTPRIKLPTISGSIPHPYNRPAGCPFHPRCPDFMPGICDMQEPNLLPVGDRQAVSCFLYERAKVGTMGAAR